MHGSMNIKFTNEEKLIFCLLQ